MHSNKKLKTDFDNKFLVKYENNQATDAINPLPDLNDPRKEFVIQARPNRYRITSDSSVYLSKREMECVKWLKHGKTAGEIGMILNITKRTVDAHVSNIKEKLGIYTHYQLGEKISEARLSNLIIID